MTVVKIVKESNAPVVLSQTLLSEVVVPSVSPTLWEADGSVYIKPKSGKLVKPQYIDANEYTDADADKVSHIVLTGDGTKFLGDDGDYTTIDISDKQDTLVSGTNIKTINSNSILGSGDLTVSGVPSGGTTGQLLSKNSNTNYDVEWSDPATATPKSGTGTITTTGWASNTGDYAYKLDLAITGIESSDVIMVSVNLDNMDIATACQLCPTIDSYAGGLTFYAKTVPTDTIGFSYYSVVTTSQTGGDFTKGISFVLDGNVALATGLCGQHAPLAMTIKKIYMSCGTAPTGADLIIDINKNGSTMYSTQSNRPKITAGNTTTTVSLPNTLSIAEGDLITFDIDQVGSTVPGGYLRVMVVCEV